MNIRGGLRRNGLRPHQDCTARGQSRIVQEELPIPGSTNRYRHIHIVKACNTVVTTQGKADAIIRVFLIYIHLKAAHIKLSTGNQKVNAILIRIGSISVNISGYRHSITGSGNIVLYGLGSLCTKGEGCVCLLKYLDGCTQRNFVSG